VGFWKDRGELESRWSPGARFEPRMEAAERERLLAGWHKAVGRSLRWAD
jgi:glycerol kinase